MSKHLPAYPLITVDPYFSIWSMQHTRLYKDNTRLWCGFPKNLHGVMMLDDKAYRFMGESDVHHMHQKVLKVTPLCTTYVFEKHDVQLKVEFWTPLFPDDIHIMSLPCSFIDYEVTVLDKRPHSISITLSVDENFCYDCEKGKEISGDQSEDDSFHYAFMGQSEQTPLEYSGDRVAINWGKCYISGGFVSYGKPLIKRNKRDDYVNYLKSEHKAYEPVSDKYSAFDVIAYDDIYSVEYLGQKLKGIWTEKFPTMVDALKYCCENHTELRDKVSFWNKKLLKDAQRLGDDYCSVLSVAYRQVMAAHKLVRSPKGELLYLSKECDSNGSIGTVDVSYPSSPLFYLYNPELVRGMMNGICEFARLPVWDVDFAPHDLGTYPLADGQTYGLFDDCKTDRREIYKSDDNSIYNFESQMPVEECGNMLIMAYVYSIISKNNDFIEKNDDLLKRWADYLVKIGNNIELQLCTDDFAGKLAGNINLAIKSCTAIKCYAEICKLLDKDGSKYETAAKQNAEEIKTKNPAGDCLALSFDKHDSWSLKYNIVWNYILDFDLFDTKTAKTEVKKYIRNQNEYGTPLDSRRDYTKSDWLMWASALDETGFLTQKYSEDLLRFLDHSEDKAPFTDWYDTRSAKMKGFCHRSVQGGLWMPLFAKKFNELINQDK